MKTLNIYCSKCRGKYKADYENSDVFNQPTPYGVRDFVKCLFCGEDARVQGEACLSFYSKPHIKGFFDYKGEQIPVDTKGDVVDKKDNPYENDGRGWKHAGHKNVKGYERGVIFR